MNHIVVRSLITRKQKTNRGPAPTPGSPVPSSPPALPRSRSMAMAPHRRSRSPPSSPPRLPDHLFEDIFFRLPPEDPSCLLRASLVCKHWRYLICHPRFVRYLHAHRRAPQMLGFLQNSEKGRLPTYVPTSPFPFPSPDRGAWHVLGYRHGRALFSSKSTERLLLVWEPFTGERWEVTVPADFTI